MFQSVTKDLLHIAAAIHAEAWRESHKDFCSPAFVAAHTTARQMAYLQSELDAGKAIYLLTLDSPKGIVSVQGDLIENLYVLPGEQRKGYGTMLLRFAERHCTQTPRLWVLNNNRGACALYQRAGYGFTGNRKHLNETLEELEMVKKQDMHTYDNDFWSALDQLAQSSELVIDRPKGSTHPRFPDYVYPLDYGYWNGTSSMDGAGIDVWLGSRPERTIDGVLCLVDLVKRDSEIKVLMGCTEAEIQLVYEDNNNTDCAKAVLIRRSRTIQQEDTR